MKTTQNKKRAFWPIVLKRVERVIEVLEPVGDFILTLITFRKFAPMASIILEGVGLPFSIIKNITIFVRFCVNKYRAGKAGNNVELENTLDKEVDSEENTVSFCDKKEKINDANRSAYEKYQKRKTRLSKFRSYIKKPVELFDGIGDVSETALFVAMLVSLVLTGSLIALFPPALLIVFKVIVAVAIAFAIVKVSSIIAEKILMWRKNKAKKKFAKSIDENHTFLNKKPSLGARILLLLGRKETKSMRVVRKKTVGTLEKTVDTWCSLFNSKNKQQNREQGKITSVVISAPK